MEMAREGLGFEVGEESWGLGCAPDPENRTPSYTKQHRDRPALNSHRDRSDVFRT